MKKLILAFVLFATPAFADWAVSDMNKQIDQTNFVVNQGCSGTLIDLKERLVLTANHCIDDQYVVVEEEEIDDKGEVKKKKVRKLLEGSVSQLQFDAAEQIRTVTYKTRLLAYDSSVDIALLQIVAKEIPNTKAAPIACTAPVRGEKVYAVGNPMGILYSSVTQGIVSSNQRTYGTIGVSTGKDLPLVQFSSGIIGGNSGGAMYNDKGELAGIPVRGNRANEILGFAVPLEQITKFLKDKKQEQALPKCD